MGSSKETRYYHCYDTTESYSKEMHSPIKKLHKSHEKINHVMYTDDIKLFKVWNYLITKYSQWGYTLKI